MPSRLLRFLAVPIVILASLGLSTSAKQDEPPSFDPNALELELKWESNSEFLIPESVFFDQENEILYVSNINGGVVTKDGNGFISTMNLSGEILELEWATGLDAPKGMNIFEGSLFVADLDQIVEIDSGTGEILNRFQPDGAELLNDIAISETGTMYITDTIADRIYVLNNGETSLLLESALFSGLNGITYDESEFRLLTGSNRLGALQSIDLEDLTVSTLVQGFGAFDGIVPDGNGNYWVSDFNGRIFLTNLIEQHQFSLPLRHDSADIEYIISQKLLIVPTFRGNQVVAFEVMGD